MSDQATQQQPSGEEREERSAKTGQPDRPERADRPARSDRGGRRRHQQQTQQQSHQRRPEAALNMEELRELVELIAQHGFTDFELEREGIRVRLRRELAPQAVAAVAATPPAPQLPAVPPIQAATTAASPQPAPAPVEKTQAEASTASEDEGLHIIPSPIVGTFYRSPSPTAEAFVRLGSHVDSDTVVCIIEAMKLMNEIQAETSGEVAKIYVENGQPVEYGQPLFGIKQ